MAKRPTISKRVSSARRAPAPLSSRAAHHAVRLHAHVRVALKTVLILCGAAGLAAVAAFFTIRQAETYVGVSLDPVPRSSVQPPGARAVPMLGLRLQAYGQPVSVRHLSFSVLTDHDGQFENGIANDVDPAQALSQCTLVDAAGTRLSGPLAPSSASRTLDFAVSLDLASRQNAVVRVLCDLGAQTAPGPGSDQLALVLEGPQDVQTAIGATPLPISAVSLGWFNKPLNDKGAVVSVWRGRPASAAGSASAPAASAPSLPAAWAVTVTAMPVSPIAYLLPRQSGVPIARFRLDATRPTTIRTFTFVDCLGYDGDGNCTGAKEGRGDAHFVRAIHLTYADTAGVSRTATSVPSADGVLSFGALDLSVSKSATVSLLADTGAFDPSLSGAALSFAFVDSGSFAWPSGKTVPTAFKAEGAVPGSVLTDDTVPGLSGVSSGMEAVFVKSRPALSRAAKSPDGSMRAGMDETLRFTVTAQGQGPIDLYGFAFHVTATDRTGSGWLSCDRFASSANWGMRDAADLSTRLEDPGDWMFFQANGSPCVPGGTLAYAAVDFTRAGDPQPKAVGSGSARTFAVRVDTSGAGAGDTLRLDLPAQSLATASALAALHWTDTWLLKPAQAFGLPGLPLSGGTLRF